MSTMSNAKQSRDDATGEALTRLWCGQRGRGHLCVWMVIVSVLGNASLVSSAAISSVPWPCGSGGSPATPYTRTCKEMQMVPGSVSGACVNPGSTSNPSGAPELVTGFNFSNTGFVSDWVLVTDVNGTRIGNGNRRTYGVDIDPLSYELTFECVTPESKRVFPHTPCTCHAFGQPQTNTVTSTPTVWDVSCTFAVQSDTGTSVLSYQPQVMCGASYLEVGSVYPS
jgi:hypothetical protein